MSDLVSRVLAAIEETERNAEAMKNMRWVFTQARMSGRTVMKEYFTRHDPAAVLRRCIADRTIIHEHSAETVASLEHGAFGQEFQVCRRCAAGPNRVVYPCPTVKHLAAGYGISVEEETTGE